MHAVTASQKGPRYPKEGLREEGCSSHDNALHRPGHRQQLVPGLSPR